MLLFPVPSRVTLTCKRFAAFALYTSSLSSLFFDHLSTRKMIKVEAQKTGACLMTSKNRFGTCDEFSDVTLLVEDQKLHVNKTLLMVNSPVFRKMFTADFKEKDLREIPLPGKKYSTMVELLEQIYPGDGVGLIKYKTLEDLLELANEYDIQQVFHNTTHFLDKRLRNLSVERDTNEILVYLGIVERYTLLRSLRRRLVHLAARISVSDIEDSSKFSSVPPRAMRDVLLLRLRAIEANEGDFSNHIRRWIDELDD